MERGDRALSTGILTVAITSAFLLIAATPSMSPNPEPTPSTSPTPQPSLVPGDTVFIGHIGAVVPPPGMAVVAYGDLLDGTAEELVVQTLPDGTVLVNPPQAAISSPSPSAATFDRRMAPATDPGQCSDNYTQADAQGFWASTMNWYFKDSSKPAGLTGALADLRAAVTNITQENNVCGRPDTVSATASYQGSTTLSANMSGNTCSPYGDGFSVVDFGTLTSPILSLTCNWENPGGLTRIESDIRLSKCCGIIWTTGETCPLGSTAYYVEGVATHERGHTWNVQDFPTGHSNLTMGQAKAQCPSSDEKSTLGLGDMLSLELNY